MAAERKGIPIEALGLGVVSLVALGFMTLWYNSYLGVTTDGWFFFFAQQLLRGHVPYRDFHCFAPPFHILEIAAVIRLFGEKLIAVHILGVVQRVLLTAVLFKWLATIFRPGSALAASLVTLVLFSGDIADTVFFYHHDSVFWGVLAGFAGSRFLDLGQKGLDGRRWWIAGALAGLLAGVCFVTKQTTGLGVSAAIGTASLLIVGRGRGMAAGLKQLVPYGAGWWLAVAPVWVWLSRQDALGAYFDQVFLRASSKGSLLQVLTRPFYHAIFNARLADTANAAIVVLLLILILRRLANRTDSDQNQGDRLALLATGMAVLVAILAGKYVVAAPRFPRLAASYLTLFGLLGLNIGFAWRCIRAPLRARDGQRWLLAATALGLCYMFSLSWPAWELMLMPGLAILLAEGVADLPGTKLGHALRGTIWVTCLVGIMLATAQKLDEPYAWGEWKEPPIRDARTHSRLEPLTGFRLGESTAAFVETVTDLIRAYSQPSEAVFVFPHLPIFYVLSDRSPPTFAYTHWFDVAPDHISERDAKLLLENPPRVIVDYEISQREWVTNEILYRNGRPSGQRHLLAAIHELIARGDYELVGHLPAQGTESQVRIWARTRTTPKVGSVPTLPVANQEQ